MSHAQRLASALVVTMFAAFSTAAAIAQQGDLPPSIAKRDPAAAEAYLAAKQLMADEKYKQAIIEANNALRIDPTFPEAHVVKGDALKAGEDYQGAVLAYTDALNFDQNLVDAYNGKGEAYMEMGQFDLAMNNFRDAQQRDPNNAKVLSNMGHIYVTNLGDPTNGLRVLGDALALDPSDARAYRDQGYAHAQLREFDEAVASLQKAAEADPEEFENYQMLAVVYQFQEKYAESIDALSKAIEKYEPTKRGQPKEFLEGYLLRADAHVKVGEQLTDPAQREAAFEAAIADTEALLSVYDDRFPESGIAWYRRGRAERMLERYADAIDSFTRAIQVVPADQEAGYISEAYMYRGICWYYIESYDLARSDFERASAIGSGYQDPRVFVWIGFTHHAQGEYREAIDAYNEAIAKDADYALAYVNRGRAYFDLKEYRRALESFNNAINVEPDDAEHYYKSGVSCMKLDEPERAVHFLELALRKDNAAPRMYRAMAAALRDLGRDELAREYEQKAENPENQADGG